MNSQKKNFNKKPFTYIQQLELLKERGLNIEDEEKAIFLLENISYYRLSGYWYPLLRDKKNHLFKPNATFNTAFNIYCFDKELRKLVLSELEKIEISIRAKMIYILSHKHGPFWFQKKDIFKNTTIYDNTISAIEKEYSRSDEEFIRSYKNNYLQPLPPSWIILEITSFGSLSKLYDNLLPSIEKREIANYYGLSDRVFSNWLHSIVYLRNVCAHHTRLWNRVMLISPTIPKQPHFEWIENKNTSNSSTYYMLCVIKYLLIKVNPNNKFKQKIKQLYIRYNNVSPLASGFYDDWEKEKLWRN